MKRKTLSIPWIQTLSSIQPTSSNYSKASNQTKHPKNRPKSPPYAEKVGISRSTRMLAGYGLYRADSRVVTSSFKALL